MSPTCVCVFLMDDLDLSGSIQAGPGQCDQRIPGTMPGSGWVTCTQPQILMCRCVGSLDQVISEVEDMWKAPPG